MNKPKPSLEQLKHLCPFDPFSEQQMVLVVAKSIVKEFTADEVVIEVGTYDKLEHFLLEGGVELESFDGRFKQISAGSESAHTAVALLQPRKYNVKTKTPCVFALIQQTTVNALLQKLPNNKSTEFSVSDLHSGHEIEDIAHSFEADL
ncbi:MAG: signal-transduction protein with cAMP-binding, CBS, and nucleotidyltransferase domain [Oleiphilaceae bacterium]|jgi:signal-transduction protein with cAMP-binding, CBS, and nucleotidyltransferase domain